MIRTEMLLRDYKQMKNINIVYHSYTQNTQNI